jgi:hypothetical protein
MRPPQRIRVLSKLCILKVVCTVREDREMRVLKLTALGKRFVVSEKMVSAAICF